MLLGVQPCSIKSVHGLLGVGVGNQPLSSKALQVAADKYSIVICWHEPSRSTLNMGQKA